MIKNLFDKYMQGNERTVLLKKNILGSFFIKGWTCLVQLILVPVTLDCLNLYEYGIWLTISSLLIWIDSFDIGLGNGLRNLLAESIAKNDLKKGQQQVSTAFFMLVCIMAFTTGLLIIIIQNINIYHLLNVKVELTPNLNQIIIASIAMVGTTFVFKFIGNVYLALQLPAINNLLVAIGHTIALIGIFIVSRLGHGTLLQVAVIYTGSPLITYLLSYPITFTKYYFLRPTICNIDIAELPPLFNYGVKFFLIQAGGLIIFASSNLLISNFFSPLEVTPYQIAYRYFGLTNILFTIISAPIWSATTDAYVKNDWSWIKHAKRKMNYVMLVIYTLLISMLFIAQPIYILWIGKDLSVPFSMSLSMMLYMIIIIYGTCYSNFICGLGKLRILTITTIVEAIIYIPLAIKMSAVFGVIGIIYALITVNLASAIINKIQFEKLCSNNVKGLWNL